jgi:hypothetical protein
MSRILVKTSCRAVTMTTTISSMLRKTRGTSGPQNAPLYEKNASRKVLHKSHKSQHQTEKRKLQNFEYELHPDNVS